MKKYRIKVTEKHIAFVWVNADSEESAMKIAPGLAECEYDCVYDCEVDCISKEEFPE